MRWILWVVTASALIAGCHKEAPNSQERPPVEVSVISGVPHDTPVTFEYVGQWQRLASLVDSYRAMGAAG